MRDPQEEKKMYDWIMAEIGAGMSGNSTYAKIKEAERAFNSNTWTDFNRSFMIKFIPNVVKLYERKERNRIELEKVKTKMVLKPRVVSKQQKESVTVQTGVFDKHGDFFSLHSN